MTPFKIECPDCGASLKISDPSHIGKMAKCPKCRGHVKVTSPDDEEFLSGFDSNEYEDLPYEPEPEPRKVSKPKKKKPRPRVTRRSGNNPLARAGIAAGVVVGVLAAIYFAAPALNLGNALAWLGGSSGIGPDLTWLPDDAVAVGEIRVSQLAQTPLVTEVLKRPEAVAGVAMMTGMLGFNLHDVDSVRIGYVATPTAVKETRLAGVVKLLKPGRVAALLEGQSGSTPPGATKVPHGSRMIYTVRGTPEMSVCCLDDQTILFGTLAELKGVLDKEGRAESTSRFAFLDKPHQIALFLAPDDPDSPGYFDGLSLDFFKKTQASGMSLCADVDADLHVTFLSQASSGKAAQEFKAGFDNGFQRSLQSSPAALDPQVQQILSSAKTTVSGRVMSFKVDFPADGLMKALAQAPASPGGPRLPFGPPSFFQQPPSFPAPATPVAPTFEADEASAQPPEGNAVVPANPVSPAPAPALPAAPVFPSQAGSGPPRPGAVAPPPAARRASGF